MPIRWNPLINWTTVFELNRQYKRIKAHVNDDVDDDFAKTVTKKYPSEGLYYLTNKF